jgi:hypothetical protein
MYQIISENISRVRQTFRNIEGIVTNSYKSVGCSLLLRVTNNFIGKKKILNKAYGMDEVIRNLLTLLKI